MAPVEPPGASVATDGSGVDRSEEHTSELQSLRHLVCRLLLEKKEISGIAGQSADRPSLCRWSWLQGRARRAARGTPVSQSRRDTDAGRSVSFFFFFLKDPGPRDFPPFPHRPPFQT